MAAAPVPMYDPQGTLRDVPFSALKDAVSNGGVPAHAVQTPEVDPNTGKPKIRMVPVTRLKEAVENGGTIQPLASDEAHLPTAYGFTLGNLASNAWEGAKSVVKGAGALAGDLASNPNWVEGPDSTLSKFVFKPADAEATKAKDLWNQGRYSEAIGHGLAAGTPLVGPAAAQLGEQAGTGDVGGAIAKGGGMVAGGAALNLAGKGIKAGASKAIDAALEDPKAVASVPVRLAARGAETAINQKLVPLRPLANIMTPADAAESVQFKVPGRDYGLPEQPEPELDATGENRPFAGGMDEAPPARTSARPIPEAPVVEPATAAALKQQLNDAVGYKPPPPVVTGVSLKNQAVAQGVKLPDGFTPVDSTMLKGYKYDPASQEFDAVLNDGQRYRHAGVTPDQVAAFEDANSKGAAYNKAIRNGPGVTPLGKVDANGTLIPRVKPSYRSATPEDVAPGETANQPAAPPQAAAAKPGEDYTAPLQQMLDEVMGQKKAAARAGADTSSSSILNRLVKGEAGQAGAPGSVTDADEGIADIQNRPVLNTLTREIPARGYLNGIGADENSVLKTQGDLDSVFYHRQQIAKNGTPNVELHVDEGNNIIGANGRHRALAAIQQGGPNAKVNLTIFRHPDPTP